MKMMIWENSRIGIYTVGWGWILLISFFGVVQLEMGCKKNITSVSNGSGLGLGLELNYCNGSYHPKNSDCCVWAGFHQNTRPGHAQHFQSKLVMESWLYRNKIYMWMMKSWELFHLLVCKCESEEYSLCSCWEPRIRAWFWVLFHSYSTNIDWSSNWRPGCESLPQLASFTYRPFHDTIRTLTRSSSHNCRDHEMELLSGSNPADIMQVYVQSR